MSSLTVELVSASKVYRPRPQWHSVFRDSADRLFAEYGVRSLGNYRDPVREIFYIVLSARTTDRQYRRTNRALRRRFPTLSDLASATEEEILSSISNGGLGNKRASQVRRIAVRLSRLGVSPSRELRKMGVREVYDFLTALPGVGPKSALCVMMYSLDRDVFPVDANVQRIAARMGAIAPRLKHRQAQQVLPALVPEGRSKDLHVGLVVHGRAVCLPRNPRCGSCVLLDLCKYGRKKTSDLGKDGRS